VKEDRQRQRQKQIPFGDDKQKATATTKATATASATTTAKARCGGLSTPQRTMKLSAAPVEMTLPLVGFAVFCGG